MLGWILGGGLIIFELSFMGIVLYNTKKRIDAMPKQKSKKQLVIESDEFKINDGNVKEHDRNFYFLTDEQLGLLQEEKTKCTCDKCTCDKKENTKETEKKEEIFVELDRDK